MILAPEKVIVNFEHLLILVSCDSFRVTVEGHITDICDATDRSAS
jgi:hypothetical protein